MILTRRAFNAALATTAFAATAGFSPFSLLRGAFAEDAASQVDLATPSPLGDMGIGEPNAAITIIEYASMTCPHCAHFHDKVYPKLKALYPVTTISGVPAAGDELKALAGRLKKRCGVGGSVKDGVIELQGDHRDAVLEVLKADGYDAVLAGG